MRFEERVVWTLNALLGCVDTDGGHIALLAIGAVFAAKVYPMALAAIGAALLLKLKQQKGIEK